MPQPKDRYAPRKFVRTVGSTKMIFGQKKPSKKTCALCGTKLHGVPHGKNVAEVRGLAGSQRAPSAPFGGVLCEGCRENVVKESAKVKSGFKNMEDVDLHLRKYLEQMEVKIGGYD